MKTSISRAIDAAKPKYPCLMESNVYPGKIVLFNNIGRGTVVAADQTDTIGHYSDSWGMTAFKPFHGVVHLDSEK